MEPEHPVIAGLNWILKNTRQPDGSKWSMRALSEAAGKSPQYVETLRAGRIDPSKIGADVLDGLARAGGVSAEWLRTGDGPRHTGARARHVEREHDVYASFEQWLAMSDGGKGLVPGIVNALRVEARRERNAEGDPGVAHWSKRYRELIAEKKSIDELRALTPDDFE